MAKESERQFKLAISAAIALAIDSIDLKELRKALKLQDTSRILQLLNISLFRSKLSEIKSAQVKGFSLGAGWAAEQSARLDGLDFTQEVASKRLRESVDESVEQITTATFNNLNAVVWGVLASQLTLAQATSEIISSYGLSTAQQYRLEKHKKQLRERGASPDEVMRSSAKLASRLKQERINLVASNEAFKAFHTGKDLYWSTLVSSGILPATSQRKWITSIDELTCPTCRPMNGQLSGVDGYFRTGDGDLVRSSPAHPSCRCSTILI